MCWLSSPGWVRACVTESFPLLASSLISFFFRLSSLSHQLTDPTLALVIIRAKHAINSIMETSTSIQFQTQNNHHYHSRQQQQHLRTSMNKSSSRNSESTEYHDSPHSPLRSEAGSPPYASPVASLERLPENSKAIIAVDKQTQFSPSPLGLSVQREGRNLAGGDRYLQVTARTPASGSGGGENEKSAAVTTIMRRSRTRDTLNKVMLWARILEAAICMSSFAVMAADKTQGWSGDSFDRYIEYRYK